LKEILLGAGFSSALDNARDLLMRLYSISYANEKMIYELLSNFERMMLQDLEILKQADVSAEAIGKLIANMELSLRQIQQISHNEVQKLLSERQKTP
jgi:hypothetical protein